MAMLARIRQYYSDGINATSVSKNCWHWTIITTTVKCSPNPICISCFLKRPTVVPSAIVFLMGSPFTSTLSVEKARHSCALPRRHRSQTPTSGRPRSSQMRDCSGRGREVWRLGSVFLFHEELPRCLRVRGRKAGFSRHRSLGLEAFRELAEVILGYTDAEIE